MLCSPSSSTITPKENAPCERVNTASATKGYGSSAHMASPPHGQSVQRMVQRRGCPESSPARELHRPAQQTYPGELGIRSLMVRAGEARQWEMLQLGSKMELPSGRDQKGEYQAGASWSYPGGEGLGGAGKPRD
ncbi:unnamed protein product [Caretta caretta]